ncbi:short chain dehydrogenase [Colletotrichum falcatum]|nr:short chain dehydrogenase [Colletotrichum falcatum]
MAMSNSQTRTIKNVVISGGARGIGRALTRYFLEAGHKVYVFDIDEDELEYTTRVHLKTHHDTGRLAYGTCNLRDVDDIRAKVAAAAAPGGFLDGTIDVLVNNGGIASPYWRDGKTMEDPDTLGEWRAYVDTNLTGPFAMSQACVPYMKARRADAADGAHMTAGKEGEGTGAGAAGPCILLIGSFRAHQSDPNQEGYAASKAGQLGLMHSMAISLGALGIRVNLIAPGRIKVGHESREGDEAGRIWEEQVLGEDVDDHPANRAGRPKDIADAALYLMDAGFVTGQDLVVDGGALRKKN